MDNYKMRIERRYDSSWFTDKIISNKRLVFALIYYFVGHLFIVPSITIFFLSSFTSLSVEQISDVFSAFFWACQGSASFRRQEGIFLPHIRRLHTAFLCHGRPLRWRIRRFSSSYPAPPTKTGFPAHLL